jgi:hypothetical protein
MVYLRINSHRATDKVKTLLKCELDWYYTFEEGGKFIKVTQDQYDTIKESKIKSVTKPRYQNDNHYNKCWNFG